MDGTFEVMAKKQYNFRLEPKLIEDLTKLANKENRSVTNYIETVLLKHVEEIKKRR